MLVAFTDMANHYHGGHMGEYRCILGNEECTQSPINSILHKWKHVSMNKKWANLSGRSSQPSLAPAPLSCTVLISTQLSWEKRNKLLIMHFTVVLNTRYVHNGQMIWEMAAVSVCVCGAVHLAETRTDTESLLVHYHVSRCSSSALLNTVFSSWLKVNRSTHTQDHFHWSQSFLSSSSPTQHIHYSEKEDR